MKSRCEELIEKYESLDGTPSSKYKRVSVRDSGTTDVPSSNKFGLSKATVIGWFSTKHNPAFGWSIHNITSDEKKEFGSKGVYRTLQDEKMTTSIIKIDFKKGTYAFLDNNAYTDGDVKFDKMSPYSRVIIDGEKLI